MASILERNKNMKPKQKTREEYAEDALYREVWEEVNNEKTMRFVKKYYRFLLGAAFAIMIVAVAVQIGVRHVRATKIAAAMNYEAAAMQLDANALASIASRSRGAMSDLALFQSYMIDQNIETLEKLAKNGKTRDFRDLARIHIVSIRGGDMTAEEVESYLSGLDTKKSPYYYTGRLIVAQKWLDAGNTERASRHLGKIINDADAPAVISATAAALQ